MSQLELLKVFVLERLRVAADEILGAVEKTIIDYEDISRCNRLHCDFKHEEAHTAVTEDISVSEGDTHSEHHQAEQWDAVLGQNAETSPFQEAQEHWANQGEEADAVALSFRPGPLFTKCNLPFMSSQMLGKGEEDSEPSTSTAQLETAPKEEDCGDLGLCSDWKPSSSEILEAEIDHANVDSFRDSRGLKSQKKMEQRDKLSSVSCQSNESGGIMNPASFRKGPVDPLCCRDCGECFQYRIDLMKHVRMHSKYMTNLNPQGHVLCEGDTINVLGNYREQNTCEICGKTFTQKSHMKRHMWVHTGQKPYSCKDCGKRFGRTESLRIHRRVHTVERPYICGICGKTFSQKNSLNVHIRSHTGEKPYGCDICLRTFAYKKDLTRHEKIHIDQHNDGSHSGAMIGNND